MGARARECVVVVAEWVCVNVVASAGVGSRECVVVCAGVGSRECLVAGAGVVASVQMRGRGCEYVCCRGRGSGFASAGVGSSGCVRVDCNVPKRRFSIMDVYIWSIACL